MGKYLKPLLQVAFASLITFSTSAFATICDEVAGRWQGEWEDEHRRVVAATLNLTRISNNSFDGNFILSDGSNGPLHGSCQQIQPNEAYLTLREDAPWFNPCRGSILRVDKTLMVHFYCFKPNQSGYFTQVQNNHSS